MRAAHPRLVRYRDSGIGGVEPDGDVVGFVDVALLRSMPWNAVEAGRVARYIEALRAGAGFEEPVVVLFDPVSRLAVVGEGNHRVAAAAAVGLTHVPTRCARDRLDEQRIAANGGAVLRVVPAPAPFVQADGRGGQVEYWPSSFHPVHVFPRETVPPG